MNEQLLTADQLAEHVAAIVAERLANCEPWLDKRGLAAYLCCSVRSVEQAMADGMPYAVIFGRAKFRTAQCEHWLARNGYLRAHNDGNRVVPDTATGRRPRTRPRPLTGR